MLSPLQSTAAPGAGGPGGAGAGLPVQPPSPAAQSARAEPAKFADGHCCPKPDGACVCTHTRCAAVSHATVQADQWPSQSTTEEAAGAM